MQVRYDLLDCNHVFLDSVLKLISLMETGVVKGGETLVPHLFQFLVLLTYDNSKLISIPEVRIYVGGGGEEGEEGGGRGGGMGEEGEGGGG